jgi:S-adenosylmethionine synthetase
VAHTNFLFTSESVSEGHPDKVCDQISDAVLDAFLENDIKLGIADDSLVNTRLGCETLATTNKIVIAGEGRGQAPLFRKHGDKAVVDRELITKIARDVVRDIGYDQDGFSYYGADVDVLLHGQSPDIAMGVNAKKKKGGEEEGAGDQGMMFGFACTEAKVYEKNSFMPAPIYFAHKDPEGTVRETPLRPAVRSATRLEEPGHDPLRRRQTVGCTKVVVSTQHNAQSRNGKKYTPGLVKEMITEAVESALPKGWMPQKTVRLPGQPDRQFRDRRTRRRLRLTGRKIIVDTYGGYAPHGGVPSPARIPRKSIARPLMPRAISPRTWSPPALPNAAPSRSPMRSAWPTRCRFWSTRMAPARSKRRSSRRFCPSCSALPRPISPHAQAQPADLQAHGGLRSFRPAPDKDGGFSWERTDLASAIKSAVK